MTTLDASVFARQPGLIQECRESLATTRALIAEGRATVRRVRETVPGAAERLDAHRAERIEKLREEIAFAAGM